MDNVEKWALQRSIREDIPLSLQNNKTIKVADDMARADDSLVQSKSLQSSFVSAAALHQDQSSSNPSQTRTRMRIQTKLHSVFTTLQVWIKGVQMYWFTKCEMPDVSPGQVSARKRQRQTVVRITVLSWNTPSSSWFFHDGYLIDTGADVTIVPCVFAVQI